MRKLLLWVVFNIMAVDGHSQFKEKHHFLYNGAVYDIFILALDSSLTLQFEENAQRLPEKQFFDLLSKKIKAPYFAITASVVDSACNPLGLYIASGQQKKNINHGTGNGNFYLKPNGVFCVDSAHQITVTDAAHFNLTGKQAIQSGPMLVSRGIINPAFDKNSKNKFERCAVGTYTDNNRRYIVFARSLESVNFYQFADLFKQQFNCDDALVLESGGNCSMHLPSVKKVYHVSKEVCRYIVISL